MKLPVADTGRPHQQTPLSQVACSRPQPPLSFIHPIHNFNLQAVHLFLTVSLKELLAVYPLLNIESNSPAPRILPFPLKKLVAISGGVPVCESSRHVSVMAITSTFSECITISSSPCLFPRLCSLV